MKSITKCILFLLIFSTNIFAKTGEVKNNNLIVIQNIDTSAKSFVIRRGLGDQIYKGQRSLFSSKSISFIAQAISVNREFSQWQMIDPGGVVPFSTGEIVTFSYSPEKIWTEIPRMISDKEYNQILDLEKKLLLKKYGLLYQGRYQFSAGLTQGLNESTTESANNEGSRSGNSLKLKYTNSFNDYIRYELGLRFDSDILTLSDPDLEVDSQRYMLTSGLQVRFNDFWALDAIPYLTISAGYGKSQSQINDSVKVGTATILPSFTLGIDIPYSKGLSFLIEANVESLTAVESFADGVEQRTNLTQASFNLGIEFN